MAVELIAEIASNHGGSVSLAKEFIDAFAPYVDTCKFQLTRAAHLRDTDPQYPWFVRSELTLDQFADLQALCHQKGVNFLLTVYNAADVWELVELGCARVKVGSGEAHEPALAAALVSAGLKPVVSCGLHARNQTPYAQQNITYAQFMGCVTRYPAPSGVAAAMMMADLGLHGWSDHAIGTGELEAAAVCGATILETHVFLQQQARAIRPFEKSQSEMRHLRTFLNENPARFIGRWNSNG